VDSQVRTETLLCRPENYKTEVLYVVQCPKCGYDIELPIETADGDIRYCLGCNSELEVIFDRSKIDLDVIAAENPGLKIENLDLNVWPILVPVLEG